MNRGVFAVLIIAAVGVAALDDLFKEDDFEVSAAEDSFAEVQELANAGTNALMTKTKSSYYERKTKSSSKMRQCYKACKSSTFCRLGYWRSCGCTSWHVVCRKNGCKKTNWCAKFGCRSRCKQPQCTSWHYVCRRNRPCMKTSCRTSVCKPGYEQVTSKPACSVTVYTRRNYRGTKANLKPGNYNTHALSKLGISNKAIRSIRVKGTCYAELFSRSDFRGAKETLGEFSFDSSASKAIHDSFNSKADNLYTSWKNRVSSIRVKMDCFTRKSLKCKKGCRSRAAFASSIRRAHANAISSIRRANKNAFKNFKRWGRVRRRWRI